MRHAGPVTSWSAIVAARRPALSLRAAARSRMAPALALGVACLMPAAGCAAKYTLRSEQPGFVLQWPFQPLPAKLTYLESLTGLGRQKGFGASFRAVVYGREKEDQNAFILPVAVAVGADGRIAVADMGRRCVHLYIPAEQRYQRITGIGKQPFSSPVGVIFDDDLTLYVSDSAGRVHAIDRDGAPRFTLRAAGEAALQRPTGLAWSPDRRLLYVVDTLANKIHAFDKEGRLALSFGERGAAPGQFNFPTHIFRSRAGELFVTDSLNFRVEIFDEDGRPRGSFGRHGDGSGDIAMPKGLAVDKDGVIYLVDSLFDNVQLFDRQGGFLLTLGKRGGDFGEFWLPSGMFIGQDDRLYVCDTYNRRVQVFRIAEGYAAAKS